MLPFQTNLKLVYKAESEEDQDRGRSDNIQVSTVSVLWQEEGFTVKYSLSTRELRMICPLLFLYWTGSNQSLQQVSAMPQRTLDKSSRQYNLFGYHTWN